MGGRTDGVRARAELTAARALRPGEPCRLVHLRDAAPVAWRPTPEAVYLVGSAASPVGDDQVEIDVAVQEGASLRLRSAAATVAWRTTGTGQRITASVADGALLDWHPQPFIATAGCRHLQHVRLQLSGTGQVHWVEEVVLGRHHEAPGRLDLRLDLDLDGVPLLRHQLALGPGIAGWDGPAVIGSHRCVGLILDAGRCPSGTLGDPSGGQTATSSWAALDLDGPGRLVLAVANDLPALRVALTAASQRTAGEPPRCGKIR